MLSAKPARRGATAALLCGLALASASSLRGAELTKPVASYVISCALDPDKKTVTGTEEITWTNTTTKPARTLQMHLYLNAFRNTLSTLWRESRGESRTAGQPIPDSRGYVEISRMTDQDST